MAKPAYGKEGYEDALQAHRIRITLTSRNVKSLEKGEEKWTTVGSVGDASSVVGLARGIGFGQSCGGECLERGPSSTLLKDNSAFSQSSKGLFCKPCLLCGASPAVQYSRRITVCLFSVCGPDQERQRERFKSERARPNAYKDFENYHQKVALRRRDEYLGSLRDEVRKGKASKGPIASEKASSIPIVVEWWKGAFLRLRVWVMDDCSVAHAPSVEKETKPAKT